jgi:hypothetical protein
VGLVACGWVPNRIARSAATADAVFAGGNLLLAGQWRGKVLLFFFAHTWMVMY